MHTEYLQSLRFKLQKRVRRQRAAGYEMYTCLLQQLWHFMLKEPTLVAVLADLHRRAPDAASTANTIITEGLVKADGKGILDGPVTDEQQWAAISMEVLQLFAKAANPVGIVRQIIFPQSSTKFDDYFAAFSDLYLVPFYEYLDERLDDPQFVLGRLVRFKHLAEWFWRDELFRMWEQADGRGEKSLGMRLYEFLFVEGLELHIEPWSASGEADMVSSQEGSERLIADAKVFNPEKSKSAGYIVQGFRQVYQYLADYNEAIGYLVIFNTSNKQLRFAVSGPAAPLPYVALNHKTIFFLVIDLFPHDTSASKRPQPQVIEVREEQITPETEDVGPSSIS